MSINWKVRLKNPVFWAQIAIAFITPILVGLGLEWQDMTSWQALFDALCRACCNPTIVVAVAASVWTALTDPTTKGLRDSSQALTYSIPKEG